MIAFPSTASDISTAINSATPTVSPPANTVSGDLLMAAVITRDQTGSYPSTPSGWTQLTDHVSIGSFWCGCLPVPNAGSLPANWTWNTNTTRSAVIVHRVTGASLSSPIAQAGTPVSGGSNGGAALPLVLPGVTAAGAWWGLIGSFWTGTPPTSDFVPGMTLLKGLSPTSGAAGMGVYTAVGSGATGSITTANDWTGATGQDGVLIGLRAAGAVVTAPAAGPVAPALMTMNL